MVYVISIVGKPLMPCKPVIARLLVKQGKAKVIWRQNNNDAYLAKQFWNNRTFWSNGYFACSVGNVSKDIIVKYIENQG